MLALKTDAGSGALEQMVLAEYCAGHFDGPCAAADAWTATQSCETLMDALSEQFGTAAEFDDAERRHLPLGQAAGRGRYLKLYQPALAAGVAINPGPEWSTDEAYSKSRMRLCFASPSAMKSAQGVAALAEVCRREFGVPERIANVERRAGKS